MNRLYLVALWLLSNGPVEARAQLGMAFCVIGDVDGDACPEVACGLPWSGDGAGAVAIHSGANGERLLEFEGAGGGVGFDLAGARRGDVTAVVALAQQAERLDVFHPPDVARVRSLPLASLGVRPDELFRTYLDAVPNGSGPRSESVLVQGFGMDHCVWYANLLLDDEQGLVPGQLVRLGKAEYDSRPVHPVARWSEAVGPVVVAALRDPARIEVRTPDGSGPLTTLLIPGECGAGFFGNRRCLAPLGDIDGDGKCDLLVSLDSGTKAVLRALSGGTGATLWEVGQDELRMLLGNSVLADPWREKPLGIAGGVLVAGYEPFNECLVVLSAHDGSIRWRSRPTGAYTGYELGWLRCGPGDRSVHVLGSRFSAYAAFAGGILAFEPGPDRAPRFRIRVP